MVFDPTKPVQTYGGCAARIICTDTKNRYSKPIVALISDSDGYEYPYYFNARGEGLSFNLVNIPNKTSRWRNVYEDSNRGSPMWSSKEKAVTSAVGQPIGYLRMDYEDGKFVGAEFVPL